MPQRTGDWAMTNAEKQAAARERERKRGIVRKLVRIHSHRAQELDEIVARWMTEDEQQSVTNN